MLLQRLAVPALILAALFCVGATVYAATLSAVSDLISTSAPGELASHRIQFTVARAIPPSGRITITPEAGAFDIPSSLDFSDISLAVATSGDFVERSLAASANATDDGVAIAAGSSGSLVFT